MFFMILLFYCIPLVYENKIYIYLYNVPNDGHNNISETTYPESTIINVY